MGLVVVVKNFLEDKEKLAYYMHYAMVIANILLIIGAIVFIIIILKQIRG